MNKILTWQAESVIFQICKQVRTVLKHLIRIKASDTANDTNKILFENSFGFR